jgi:serine/threonine-protein kinase
VEKAAGVGTLALRVRPWAEIFVDGRSIGISPVSPVELPAGRHSVLLRNKSLGKERTVTTHIVRGETTTLRVDLME